MQNEGTFRFWLARGYAGMLLAGLLMAGLLRVLPTTPKLGLTLASLLGLTTATALVVRCAMRFSLPPEQLHEPPLDSRQFIREMPLALAVFALYLGLAVASLRHTVPG